MLSNSLDGRPGRSRVLALPTKRELAEFVACYVAAVVFAFGLAIAFGYLGLARADENPDKDRSRTRRRRRRFMERRLRQNNRRPCCGGAWESAGS